ncbi:hypothetical protein A2U01_0010517 [Trifolium medium]|uniref:Uncharacterized protein n=1 Tax=Trifolium medium TaxID=97028 RepID=A0A392MQ67_9FABA|nr:hypothetical protein [Trifolium medium]
MARVKKAANKNRRDCSSSSSQSPKRSPSPPSAPASPKSSGTKSTSSTSFKSLSDHDNDVEIQSNSPKIVETPPTNQTLVNTVQGTVETEHANQSQAKFVETSQIFVGTIPINIEPIHVACETVSVNIEPIQCS